jgi:hypothetical protein
MAAARHQAPKTENVHLAWLPGLVTRRYRCYFGDWLGSTRNVARINVQRDT